MDLRRQLELVEECEALKIQISRSFAVLEKTSSLVKERLEFFRQKDETEVLMAKIWDYENGILTPGDPDYDQEFASWLYQ